MKTKAMHRGRVQGALPSFRHISAPDSIDARSAACEFAGLEAVQTKAMHRGRVQGALAAARVEGQPPAAVLDAMLRRLQAAIASKELPALEEA